MFCFVFVFTIQCFKFSWIHDFIAHLLPSIIMDFLICFMSLHLNTLKLCSLSVQKPIFSVSRAFWMIGGHLSMLAGIFKWACRHFSLPGWHFLRSARIFYFLGKQFLRPAGLRAFLLCKHVCHQSCVGICGHFHFPTTGIFLYQLQEFSYSSCRHFPVPVAGIFFTNVGILLLHAC